MAQIAKRARLFPGDLTDGEWDRLVSLELKSGRRGRPREVINAVRYLVRPGCGWRMLAIHLRAW